MSTRPPLSALSDSLNSGQITSLDLTQNALAEAMRLSGEGPRTFKKVYATSALETAERADQHRKQGVARVALSGVPISIKDLFDVAGEPTPAGSEVLAHASPAVKDAPVVARLRSAGAVLVGRTNMTEFAYSGLGLNPHHGTPRNPYDRAHGRIPGGSSSGAAVSVTDGMAAAAIGTDTGGSLRIPAALCGLTGFKPTARRISLDGVLPLSTSLDSVGPIAPTVACCALIDSVLAGTDPAQLVHSTVEGLRFGCLQGYVLDDLEEGVARRFDAALSMLARAGAHIAKIKFPALTRIADCNTGGGFAAIESYRWHRQLLQSHGKLYDPRVYSRIMRGKEISDADYSGLVTERRIIMAEASHSFNGCDAWLLPTVPRIAPLLDVVGANDAVYFDANAAMLRNPSIFNFLDWCALSIPCHERGEAPVGLMIAARHGDDEKLLSLGAAVEAVLAQAGCAIHSSDNYTADEF